MNTSPNIMPWFTREQWASIKAVCLDPDTMGETYEHWLQSAEQTAKLSESPTVTVHKVYLNVDQLLAYAKRNSRDLSSKTRVDCAMDMFCGTA